MAMLEMRYYFDEEIRKLKSELSAAEAELAELARRLLPGYEPAGISLEQNPTYREVQIKISGLKKKIAKLETLKKKYVSSMRRKMVQKAEETVEEAEEVVETPPEVIEETEPEPLPPEPTGIMGWVQDNPLLAIGIGLGALIILPRLFKG